MPETTTTEQAPARWADALYDLYAAVRAGEHPDGSWPGAEVVDQLTRTFQCAGLAVEGPVSDGPTRPGAAVATDLDKLRRWLEEPDPDAPQVSRAHTIGGFDTTCHDPELLGVLEDAIAFLGNLQPEGVWQLAPGVHAVAVWRIADGDGMVDGALVTVDLAGGVRLCSLVQEERYLSGGSRTRGEEQAACALFAVATVANELVGRYRQG